ncbi:MAG: hypothetical protein JNK79_00015 [Chitinophagaceae bacterium]|nr:hypothetical protein [Chitinophagaceae bacterium]
MQSLLKPGNEAREWVAPVNSYERQDAESAIENNNHEGSIIIKEGEGVYYVRYNIILAKAGDVFFMPRMVPENFNLETDKVIPFTTFAGAFDSVSLQ